MKTKSLIDVARRMVPSLSRGIPVVYFLRLANGSIYVGASTNLELRIRDHVSGKACETTRRHPPRALLRVELWEDFSAARKRESQLKRWSGQKKEALVAEDFSRLQELAQSHDDQCAS